MLGQPLTPNSTSFWSAYRETLLAGIHQQAAQGIQGKVQAADQAFSTHTFRKTFGRYVYELMGRSAEGLILLNQIFRHSNLETTRRYIGLAQEDIDKVFNSIRL